MKSTYKGHRFPPEIIGHAIWLYHRFTLSFRDVEDLLAERGIIVSSGTELFPIGKRRSVSGEGSKICYDLGEIMAILPLT